jgi:serine/threonine protein kinase
MSYDYSFLHSINKDRGSNTLVYAASDEHGEKVAVKHVDLGPVDDDVGIAAVLLELDLLSRLDHRYILHMHSFSIRRDGESIVIDIVLPLADCTLVSWPCNTLDVKMETLKKIASGTSFLHQHGILHGDIKPDNILMLHDEPLIADFGLATPTPGRLMPSRYAPLFRVPEALCTDQFVYSLSCDVWAFGMLALWLLSGKVYPYDERCSEAELREKLLAMDERTIRGLLGESSVADMVCMALMQRSSMVDILHHTAFSKYTVAMDGGERYAMAKSVCISNNLSNVQCLVLLCDYFLKATRHKLLAFDLYYRYMAMRGPLRLRTLYTVILWLVQQYFNEENVLPLIVRATNETSSMEELVRAQNSVVTTLGGVIDANHLHRVCKKPVHYTYLLHNVIRVDDSRIYYRFSRIPLLRESLL